METVLHLPLRRVPSDALFAVLDSDLRFISGHDSADDACKALAMYAAESGNDGFILLRTPLGWFKY